MPTLNVGCCEILYAADVITCIIRHKKDAVLLSELYQSSPIDVILWKMISPILS